MLHTHTLNVQLVFDTSCKLKWKFHPMLNFCCWKILIESWKKIITVVTIRYAVGRGWVSQYPHCGGKDTWHSVYCMAFALYVCALRGICTVFPFHTERHTCIALHLHCSFEEISRVRSSHFAEASLSTPFRMACFYLLTPLRLPQVFFNQGLSQ